MHANNHIAANHFSSVFSLLSFCYHENQSALILLALCSIVSGIFGAALVGVIAQSVEAVNNNGSGNILVFIAVTICILFFRYWYRVLAHTVSASIALHVRITLAGLLVGSSLETIEDAGPADQFTVLTRDVQTITSATTAVPTLLSDAVLVAFSFAYLGTLSPLLLTIVFSVTVIGCCFYLYLMKSINTLYRYLRRKSVSLITCIRDLTEGIKELKSSKILIHAFMNTLDKTNRELKIATIKAVKLHQIGLSVGQATIYALIGIVIVIYPRIYNIESSVVIAYVVAILYISRPIQDIIDSYPTLSQGIISLRKVYSAITHVQEDTSASNSLIDCNSTQTITGESFNTLSLLNMEHLYKSKDGSHVGPIDFNIRKGEIKILCGANGSGKTTFVKMLLGLYDKGQGRIFVNSTEITYNKLDAYMNLFEVVFSDFHILKSLRNTYASKNSVKNRFVDDTVRNRMMHSRNEKNISQGEKRRFILESACASTKPILVFDEPASDLDPEFKHHLYDHVFPSLKNSGKAIILISHDDNYFYIADELIRFREGQIVILTSSDSVVP